MVINVAVGDKFAQHGGGVDDLIECSTENMHAMLLIGSGREDGKEYWLVRNSYRISWGELVHYKPLSKKSYRFVLKLASFLVANFEPDYSKSLNDNYDKQKISNCHQNKKTRSDSKERATTEEQGQESLVSW